MYSGFLIIMMALWSLRLHWRLSGTLGSRRLYIDINRATGYFRIQLLACAGGGEVSREKGKGGAGD